MANPFEVKIEEKAVDDIPEVIEFLDAQTRLEEFKAKNPQLIAELEGLIDAYNTTKQAADKAVRSKGINCGPWKQLTPTVAYDGEKLYSAVGRADFIQLGGVVRQTSEYVIDKSTLEAAIAGGRVPVQVVEVVRKVTRKYTTIPEGKLP
jgi:hypothetical protein